MAFTDLHEIAAEFARFEGHWYGRAHNHGVVRRKGRKGPKLGHTAGLRWRIITLPNGRCMRVRREAA